MSISAFAEAIRLFWFLINLATGQGKVVSLPLEKFLVATALDDDSLSDYSDGVSVLDGGETVGDDDGCSALHGIVKSCLDNLDW